VKKQIDSDDQLMLSALVACVLVAFIGLNQARFKQVCSDSIYDHQRKPTAQSYQNPNVANPSPAIGAIPVSLGQGEKSENDPCQNAWSIIWTWAWPRSDVWQAIFDFLLVIVGWRTLGVSERQRRIMDEQNTLMKRQLKIAADQYNAAHRPRLRVRNFYIDVKEADAKTGAFTGQFYVVNIGDSPCRVINSHIVVYWYNGELPMKRPFESEIPNDQFPLIPLGTGASLPAVFGPMQVLQGFDSTLDSIGQNISILGFIDYVDDAGTRRRTAFCRTYDDTRKRFTKSQNEDYEHEE
jgi:hypothetical protein